MNTFNRVVIVILLLLLIPALTAVFILPHVLLVNVGERISEWGYFFGQVKPWLRLSGGILLALITDALAILLIVLEVRPRRKRFIRVQDVTGGMASVSTESIINQLQYAIDPLPGIVRVNPSVSAKRDKVQAIVDVEITAEANIPDMAADLMDIVQRVLSVDLGLLIHGEPKVQIKVAETSRRKRPTQKQTPPPIPEIPQSPPPLEKPKEWAGTTAEDELEPRV